LNIHYILHKALLLEYQTFQIIIFRYNWIPSLDCK
jgi:hypothetical protein